MDTPIFTGCLFRFKVLNQLIQGSFTYGYALGVPEEVAQARAIIQFIADHIHEDSIRSQFLQSERVSAVIKRAVRQSNP